jgi:hypothetical protein
MYTANINPESTSAYRSAALLPWRSASFADRGDRIMTRVELIHGEGQMAASQN